jgi:hypothetical protein
MYGTLITFSGLSNFIMKPYGLDNVNKYYIKIQISLLGIFGLIFGILGAVSVPYYVKKTKKYIFTFKICGIIVLSSMLSLISVLNYFPNIVIIIFVTSINGYSVTPLVPLSYDLGC